MEHTLESENLRQKRGLESESGDFALHEPSGIAVAEEIRQAEQLRMLSVIPEEPTSMAEEDCGFVLHVEDPMEQERIAPGSKYQYTKTVSELMELEKLPEADPEPDYSKPTLYTGDSAMVSALGGESKCFVCPVSNDPQEPTLHASPLIVNFVSDVVKCMDVRITDSSNDPAKHMEVVGDLDSLMQGRGVAYSTQGIKKGRSMHQESPCNYTVVDDAEKGTRTVQYGFFTLMKIDCHRMHPTDLSYPVILEKYNMDEEKVKTKGFRLSESNYAEILSSVVESLYEMYVSANQEAEETDKKRRSSFMTVV